MMCRAGGEESGEGGMRGLVNYAFPIGCTYALLVSVQKGECIVTRVRESKSDRKWGVALDSAR